MAGLNDRRQLGTESGRIRRAARQVERAGGNPSALLNRAAEVKLGEGSAISSAEDNIAFEEKKRRLQSGLLESKRRALLSPAGTPRAGLTPVERAEGMVPQDVKTGSAPQRTTNASLNAARPGETTSQAQMRFKEARTGLAAAPAGEAGTSNQGPPRSAMVSQPTGTAPQPSLTGSPPSLLRAPMDSAAAADSRSLSRRKEMRAAEDAITGGGAPGSIAGLQSRDTEDRAAAIAAARTESAGNPSVTRGSVIDRINKERTAKGLQPFGEDIYKDIAAQGIAESDATRIAAGRRAEAESAADQIFRTPLQKSLFEAKTRFAPAPVEEPQFVASEAERQRAREDASAMVKEKARQDGASLLAARPKSLGSALLQDVESVRDSANQVVSGAMSGLGRGVRGQLNRESEALPKIGSAVKRKTGDAASGAGKSLLSKVPGATGSYLRNRFKL